MPKDLQGLMRRPDLVPPERQDLLSHVAAQAAAMNMPAYLVGGFVRDLLLERPVNDFDIVVEGDAIRFGRALVKKQGGRLTAHQKFGTAIWAPQVGNALDLITARSETYESPGALPTVKPSAIEDDLRRRDFTINAMAVRLNDSGELLDPLNGKADLEQGLIRALHPNSFVDDPTRILRAIRYESRYGFKITPDTLKLVNSDVLNVLSKLSGERIRHEFDLILGESNSVRMLGRAGELGLLRALDPALPALNEDRAVMFGTVPPADFGVPADPFTTGYLLWLTNSSAESIRALAKRLDFTADLRDALLAAVELKGEVFKLAGSKPSQWVERLDRIPLIAVYVVWLLTNEGALKEYLVNWRHVHAGTTGDDLKKLGIPPGPKYREILSKLRAARLDRVVKDANEEANLLKTFTSSSS